MEVPRVQYSDRIIDLPVVMQCQIPTIQAVQETMEVPHIQVLDPAVDVRVVMQRHAPQERVRGRIIEETDVPVPRVMEETIEVEKLKSQCFTLLADNKLSFKLDGSCAAQAPEWKELRGLRDEELVTICDINKLPNDSDTPELFKETLPSPSLMQLQGDKRGVIRRARAVVRNSSESPGVNLISMAIGIGIAEDEDTDIKSHASAIADPTEQLAATGERLTSVSAAQQAQKQQQHWHNTQQQSTRQAMQQTGQTEEERKEEKGQGERERGRKDEGGRGQEGKRKEKEWVAEVKKDVTDWTVVTWNRRQRKMVQIFVKVNGSKATPMEVNLTDDKVEDVMRRIQKDEDVYVTMHGRVLKRSERLKSCEVIDGCTVHVTDRLRGGGRHKNKRSKTETKGDVDESGQKDQQIESLNDKCQEMTQAQKDVLIQTMEGNEGYRRQITTISEAENWEYEIRCFRKQLQEKSGVEEERAKVMEWDEMGG